MNKRILVVFALVGALLLAGCTGQQGQNTGEKETLNIAGWPSYAEEELIKPFEKKHNVEVNVKTAVGDPKVISLLDKSPNTYDLVVTGPASTPKLIAKDIVDPVDTNKYPTDKFIRPLNNFPNAKANGEVYAIPVRWGSTGILYNADKVSKEEASSYSVLKDEKFKNKIGIWGYYLATMGVISKSLGHEEPFNLSDSQMQDLEEEMNALKPQVKTVLSGAADVHNALANEEVWIVPAGGEWSSVAMKQQGHNIEYIIPEEGGLMWAEYIHHVKGGNRDLAEKFIKYITSKKGQKTVAWRDTLVGIPASTEGIKSLSEKQKRLLKVRNVTEAQNLADKLQVRVLPPNQKEWLSIWKKFKAG